MSSSLPGDLALLVGAALLTGGVVLAGFAERMRAPALLLFLGLGMVIGEDVLGLIEFSDALLAQRIGVIALVVILYEGGLTTSFADARRVVAPAALLATVGVLVTAGVVSLAVMWLTGESTTTAVLIGVVIASTDAAAVFAMLRITPIPKRLTSVLEVESGGNDPMAVLLTIGVLEAWTADPGVTDWVIFGLRQLAGGAVVGVVFGYVGTWALRRLHMESAALYQALAVGVAGLAYGVAAQLGGSGFLAVYITGVLIGSTSPRTRRAVQRFHEGLASVAQIALFLILGLLVFPSQLADVLLPGFVAAIVLIFVARPLAVSVLLPWFGFGPRELLVASWAGLRGAVPIVLATFPLTVGYPDGVLIFNVVFFVVLLSASLQGLTVGPLTRRMRFSPADTARDAVADLIPIERAGIDVIEIEVTDDLAVCGMTLGQVPLPGAARVAMILRDDRAEVPTGQTRIVVGDVLFVVAPTNEQLPAELAAWTRSSPSSG